jgi:hypothetical protein
MSITDSIKSGVSRVTDAAIGAVADAADALADLFKKDELDAREIYYSIVRRSASGLSTKDLATIKSAMVALGGRYTIEQFRSDQAAIKRAQALDAESKKADALEADYDQKSAAVRDYQAETDRQWQARAAGRAELDAEVKKLEKPRAAARTARDELKALHDANRELFGREPKPVYQPLAADTVIFDNISSKSALYSGDSHDIDYRVSTERLVGLPEVKAPDLQEHSTGDAPRERQTSKKW